jgi:uncharacterized protein YacL
MGCGCKGKQNEVIEESPKLTTKYVLKKIASSIVVGIILFILTPFIVIMIWYLGMKMIIGTDDDYIGMINKKYGYNREKKSEPIEEEFNPDDYELLDVEVIK